MTQIDPNEALLLADAMRDMATAISKENAAKENYSGYSWDYHGHSYIQEVERANKEFAAILTSVIDSRVKTVLKELGVEI